MGRIHTHSFVCVCVCVCVSSQISSFELVQTRIRNSLCIMQTRRMSPNYKEFWGSLHPSWENYDPPLPKKILLVARGIKFFWVPIQITSNEGILGNNKNTWGALHVMRQLAQRGEIHTHSNIFLLESPHSNYCKRDFETVSVSCNEFNVSPLQRVGKTWILHGRIIIHP